MPAASSSDAGDAFAAGGFVLLAVGTSLDPFDRLLRLVDELCLAGAIPLPVFAQLGHSSYQPRGYQGVPFLPAQLLEQRIHQAAAVICHGGAGLIGSCLQARKRPVVVPRRVRHGEIVNDHQLELCQEMQRQGRIYLAEDQGSLISGLRAALQPGQVPPPEGGARLRQRMAELLSQIAEERRQGPAAASSDRSRPLRR